jgi:uncharacterized membrane protein
MGGRLVPWAAAAARIALISLAIWPFVPEWLLACSIEPPRWLEAWFSFQCSRQPSRVLFHAAVCARCLGIYVGLGFGALALWPRLTPLAARIWVGAASLAMMLDVASEALHMRPPAPLFRLATGLLLAYPVGVALILELRSRTRRSGAHDAAS